MTEPARFTNALVSSPARRAERRYRDELAFLPAALEIVETQPSLLGRAIGGNDYWILRTVSDLGLHWQDRYRCDCARKNHSERTHQGRATNSKLAWFVRSM